MSESKRILIVDDEPDILKAVTFRVKKAGYETLTADNGIEAVNVAQGETPDLIILDHKLPGMNGLEVYQKLKESDKTASIPIVLLTASEGSEDLASKMEEIGAEHLLSKPYEAQELLNRIKELVG